MGKFSWIENSSTRITGFPHNVMELLYLLPFYYSANNKRLDTSDLVSTTGYGLSDKSNQPFIGS